MYRYLGRVLVVAGLLHTGVGLGLFHTQLSAIVRDGLFGAIGPTQYDRGMAIFFLLWGFATYMVGMWLDSASARKSWKEIRFIGWNFLLISLAGVALFPASGFWMNLVISGLIIWSGKKSHQVTLASMALALVICGTASAESQADPCATGNANDILVQVGTWCVDRYEAVICDRSKHGSEFDHSCISRENKNNMGFLVGRDSGGKCLSNDVREGSTDCELQHSDDGSFLDSRISEDGSSNDRDYRAYSRYGTTPTVYVTIAQARIACENAGKKLLPDEVWTQAFKGTHNPGSNDGFKNKKCNTSSSSPDGARKTGNALALSSGGKITWSKSCVSDAGVEDLLGNVWEIVTSNETPSAYAVRGSGWGFGAAAIQDAISVKPDPWPDDHYHLGGAVGFRCGYPIQND